MIRLDGRGVPLCLQRLLRRGHRIDKVEELLHPSDFERAVDPIVHSDQVQTVPVLLVGDISARPRDVFYDERVLRHRDIIVCDSFGSVKGMLILRDFAGTQYW